MKYLVLARRYRPQRFCDVVGQEAVLKTLKNALSYNRAAHAYLFCGSRGIGKTTLARLFAKALNCQNLNSDFEPCNECPSCLEILSGQSLDVIEIDGASNRGIDDIRTLNETVSYAPSHGKYKIYIIDEVHMLTKEAFNALLKTLEEPPEKAKFFFATTEPHKVLPTIVSRCQRFDLQRLSNRQIEKKLREIAIDLKREASDEALFRIAQFSEGSLRDAESLFDQLLCFTEEHLSLEHVQNVLGLVPDELFASLDRAFSEDRPAFAFELVEELFQLGKDLTHFTQQLIGHYRALISYRLLSPQMQHYPDAQMKQIAASAKLYTQGQLTFILDTLLASYTELTKSPMQRVSLEALLLKILRSKNRIPLEVVARRLSELEEKLLQEHASQKQTTPLKEAPFHPMIQEEESKSTLPSIDETPQKSAAHTEELAQPTEAKTEASSGPAVKTTMPGPTPPSLTETPQKSAVHTEELAQPTEAKQATVVTEASSGPTAKTTMPDPTPPSLTETPQKSAVHTETLLRFAAVELEGTIQLEK